MPPDGENLLAIILTRKGLKEIVNNIFGKFGYKLVLRPQEGRMEVFKELEGIITSFPSSLASETLQRIVFYLAAIHSNKDSILAFEEPEAHAFPYYTKYLAEIIAFDKSGNQYFISTHNPYFLTSILEKAPENDVAVFITAFQDYQTKVKQLTEKQKKKILADMGYDIFFNIEKFLKEPNHVYECNPKTILINYLASIPKKKIEHAGEKSRVIKKLLRNYKNSTGLIDEDPQSTQPLDLQKFQETKSLEPHKIRILLHPQRNNKLIILCPRLEEWIVEASKEANIDMNKKYKLPKDPTELHKIIKIRTENFRQLIKELMQKSPRLKALRDSLRNEH